MTKQTMEDVLFEFYRKEDPELSRDFFGEQEILIPHGTAGNQPGYAWRHSEFESEDFGTMYIAGIAGMNENSFSSSNLYNGFSTSTPGWSNIIIDAEKSDSKPKDYNMCWAATDSNLMVQAGWIPAFVEDEDDIFDLYRNSFQYGDTRYGDFYAGATWFLTGRYEPVNVNPNILLDECYPGTGGYFSNVVVNDYIYVNTDASVPYTCDIIENAISDLRDGNAVGLRVVQCKWGEQDRAHIITLQGYTYELKTENNTVQEIVTGVIIADSNDDSGTAGLGGGQGSSYAPNVLQVIPVHYILGDIYLDWDYMNYMADGWSPWKITATVRVIPEDFAVVSSGGDIVRQGATILKENVTSDETLNVFTDGLALQTKVSSGGLLNVSYGGLALDTTVLSSGLQTVSHGGIASNTEVFLDGVQAVSSGGTAINTTVFHSGFMDVSSGGEASQTVLSGGEMNVLPYGYAERTVMIGGFQNVSSNGIAFKTTASAGGIINVSSGGIAGQTVLANGNAHVSGGGIMTFDNQTTQNGSIILGGKINADYSLSFVNANINYQLDAKTPQNNPLITNLSNMGGVSTLGLNVDRQESFGSYILASNGGNFNTNGTVVVTDITNNSSLLSLHDWSHSSCTAGAKTYTLDYSGGVMTLEVGGAKAGTTTACDLSYNGISDVIYISGGTDGQTIQYGLDGTSELQDEGILDSDVRIVGGYDMDWDHRVDLVTCRTAEYDSTDYLVVEYAQSGDMGNLQEIDRISIFDNVDWNVYCGNLAGHDWKNSILWHAPDLGTLGYWADGGGNESWVGIGNVYDSSWEVIGLGDFIDDSVRKDAVLFKYDGNAVVEITASGGYRALGTLGSGWDIVAIGDFSNDGVDDLILYNGILCQVGKWTDGVSTGWSSLGLVETGTTIEGAGDYDGDGGMDLLARKSDGTMGYYASANLSQFTSFGYTMDSSWTVIA